MTRNGVAPGSKRRQIDSPAYPKDLKQRSSLPQVNEALYGQAEAVKDQEFVAL